MPVEEMASSRKSQVSGSFAKRTVYAVVPIAVVVRRIVGEGAIRPIIALPERPERVALRLVHVGFADRELLGSGSDQEALLDLRIRAAELVDGDFRVLCHSIAIVRDDRETSGGSDSGIATFPRYSVIRPTPPGRYPLPPSRCQPSAPNSGETHGIPAETPGRRLRHR